MHQVASFQQFSAVLQNNATSTLACIAVTQRIWSHLLCVCMCVCVRLRRVFTAAMSSIKLADTPL